LTKSGAFRPAFGQTVDLFDNSVSFISWSATLTSLAFFRAKAGFSSVKMFFLLEVVQKLKFPNNSSGILRRVAALNINQYSPNYW
jgi:hypothetical protein